MAPAVVARDDELKIMTAILESPESEFVAVYGRRRIGKTFLIHEFFYNKGVYFEVTGMKDGTLKEQLYQFYVEFSRQFQFQESHEPPKSWAAAFHLLYRAIEKCDPTQKVILFFDEVPWFASPRSKFLNALEHFWNRYLSRHKNVILIICGSSASWIINHIINNKGGLHGRLTRKVRLLPFTLQETEQYLKSRHIELDRKQMIDIYMAMGGVPKYLSYIAKGKSAAQNINDICFTLNGGLFQEFENLYRSLFDNYQQHIAIVSALAKTMQGLTKEELLEKVKMKSGGSSSKVIQELVDAGFVAYVPTFKKKKVGGIYRLIDEYSLFHQTWMTDRTGLGLESIDETYWLKKYGTSKWNTWSGYAFEAICLKHSQLIKKALGISGISTIESGWRRVSGGQKGAQIDLVIDRADKCINLCEMKYCDTEYTLDKSAVQEIRNKKRIFREQTGVNKSLFITMITTYGVKKNSHCLEIVDNHVTIDDLFND